MNVTLPTGSALERVQIPQEVLRNLGKKFFELNSSISSVFASHRHLSSSHAELEYSMSLFLDHHSLICGFMKQNLLYDCVIPYRGVHAGGKIPPEKIEQTRVKIRDDTCVGTFYTMLGVLLARFDRAQVQEAMKSKIWEGNLGILKLATDRYIG